MINKGVQEGREYRDEGNKDEDKKVDSGKKRSKGIKRGG